MSMFCGCAIAKIVNLKLHTVRLWLFGYIKPSKLKLFDWKMLRKEEIMFKKSLYKAALAYFSDKVGSQEKKRLQKALLPLPAIVLNLNGKRL